LADKVYTDTERARQSYSEERTDNQTGLAKRREFEGVMEREVALGERHSGRLSVMMIDRANLKEINDRQGHRAGDAALRLVAQQLQRVVRASDVCARVGGDEFAVAMPETGIERAREVASRLQTAIPQVSLSSKSMEPVEVSVGAAAWRPGQDWQALYQVADSDLYEDKRRRKSARRWAAEPERPALAQWATWLGHEPREALPPRRLILVWDNWAGHLSWPIVQWLFEHGIMPRNTPLPGSGLNMAASVQRLVVGRALTGHHPETAQELSQWLEDTVVGWNAAPTPLVWGGKRHDRRQRARQRRLGGSGAALAQAQAIAA